MDRFKKKPNRNKTKIVISLIVLFITISPFIIGLIWVNFDNSEEINNFQSILISYPIGIIVLIGLTLLNRSADRYSEIILRYGAIMLFPLGILFAYYVSTQILSMKVYDTTIYFPIYVFLLFTLIYCIFIVLERMADYANRKVNIGKLFTIICVNFLTMVLSYSSLYFCLYDLNQDNFSNVVGQNYFEQYFDFTYFSLGIMTINQVSEITALTIHAKIVVMIQMITTFLFLTILLTNYQNIGKAYKRYLNKNKNQSIGKTEIS